MAESPEVRFDPGWYVAELVSTLVIAGDRARLLERWSVVAELPLDELLVELNVDGPPQRPWAPIRNARGPVSRDGTVVDAHGAEVTADDWPASASGRRIVNVRLPRPLGPCDLHTFDLTLCVPPSCSFDRHVYVPSVRCRRLELRVHFGRPGAPSAVSRVDDARSAGGVAEIPVDRAGDVAATFSDLLPGGTYGLAW